MTPEILLRKAGYVMHPAYALASSLPNLVQLEGFIKLGKSNINLLYFKPYEDS
jgi:hypothetical protein